MEESLHHLGCMKPCNTWDKLPTSTGTVDFFNQQYQIQHCQFCFAPWSSFCVEEQEQFPLGKLRTHILYLNPISTKKHILFGLNDDMIGHDIFIHFTELIRCNIGPKVIGTPLATISYPTTLSSCAAKLKGVHPLKFVGSNTPPSPELEV